MKVMTMVNKDNCCQFCRSRKELCGAEPMQECLECGFLRYRDQPYTIDIPIKEEEDCE